MTRKRTWRRARNITDQPIIIEDITIVCIFARRGNMSCAMSIENIKRMYLTGAYLPMPHVHKEAAPPATETAY